MYVRPIVLELSFYSYSLHKYQKYLIGSHHKLSRKVPRERLDFLKVMSPHTPTAVQRHYDVSCDVTARTQCWQGDTGVVNLAVVTAFTWRNCNENILRFFLMKNLVALVENVLLTLQLGYFDRLVYDGIHERLL